MFAFFAVVGGVAASADKQGGPEGSSKPPAEAQEELDKINAKGGIEKVKLGKYDPKTGKAEVDENGNEKLYSWEELHPPPAPPPAGTPILDSNRNIIGYSDGTK